MEFRFFIITFFLLMATAPLARQVVTIMGSISGVRPTATEMENSTACIQFPLVKPFMNSTTGTMMSIKRISTQETSFTPFSNVVLGGLLSRSLAIWPSTVSAPTATTTALALPLTTLLPIKARFAVSVRDRLFSAGAASFSTGSLSPVSADWLTNRSLALSILRSAGIMSPADRQTRSPTAISSMGISVLTPARSTHDVVCIMLPSFSATLPLRVSCT